MESIQTQHLLSLLSQGPTVIYTSRTSGDFGAISITDNITTQLGYEVTDFLNDASFWVDHIHPDDRDHTLAGLMSALHEHDHHEHDYRFLHKDGSYRWMFDQLRLLRDEQGEPLEIVGYWIDITERKELEQELLESAERYRSLFDTVPYGIEEVDCSGTIIAANAAHHKQYGYRDGELIGRSIMDFCATDAERVRQREYLVHLVRDRPPCSAYYAQKITQSGEVIDVEIAWNYTFDSEGNLAGFTSLITDITARKKVEEALRESDLRFNLAVTGANEGLWDKNLQTGVEYWAPRFYALMGYDDGEIDASDEAFRMLLHPDDVPLVDEAVRAHLAGHAPYEVEYRLLTKSGEYRWFRSRARAISDDSGTPCRMVGFIADITEQRQLQATLRQTEQILDSTPDPTVIMNDFGQIVFLNTKAAVFGYTREELLHQPITTMLPCFRQPATPEQELFGRRKDGSEFPVEVSLSPIDTDSETFVAAAIRDITDRKLAEEQQRILESKLQQAQKLESLGVLAGGIAHDFNNLLMGMIGNTEIALRKLPADSPVRGQLLNTVAAGVRAADLTKQMLAYSGKGKFVVEALDLSRLVAEIGDLLDVSISKSVVVEYSFAAALPAIDADPSQIQQIVMNLIINASEAIGDGNGVVTVTTSAVDADRSYLAGAYVDDGLPVGRYVCLEVTDSGCGMDDATQKRIFDPFFTTKFTGRGLGLAAVLGIIRGHGGTLKIHSRPGIGSTFQVLFPASRSATEEVLPTHSPSEDWCGAGVILVVDDDEAVRIVAKSMLETRGLSVLTACDGEEAVAVFHEHSSDIVAVLLDLTMPKMNGEETFRELRRIKSDVRVILSSGFNEQETTNRFANQGLAGFVQKPYGLDQLIDTVRKALEPAVGTLAGA